MSFEKIDEKEHYARHLKTILEMIDNGTAPWRKPWNVGNNMPANLASGRQYTGFTNIMVLGFAGFANPFWVTENKITEFCGNVIEGEYDKFQTVFYWHRHAYSHTDEDTGKPRKGVTFYPRTHKVWNVQQTEGMVHHRLVNPPVFEHPEMPDVESVINSYCENGGPKMKVGSRACYVPATDEIVIPPRDSFEHGVQWAGVNFHELAHSTGSSTPKRLCRKGVAEVNTADEDKYAREELIAELASSFLLSRANFTEEEFDLAFKSSASYLDNWSKKIKEDPKMFITASKQAEKACRLILGEAF